MRGQVLGKNIFIHRGTRSDNIIISVKKPTPNGAKRPTPNKNLCAKCGIYPSKSIYLIFLYLIFLFLFNISFFHARPGGAERTRGGYLKKLFFNISLFNISFSMLARVERSGPGAGI